MQALLYYISIPFIYIISFLPFWLLYRVSDVLYFILFYVVQYRKKIVETNLSNSFPDKSDKEIEKISKDFYKFFSDLMVETIKTLTISKEQAIKRCPLKDLTLLNQLYEEKKKVIFVLGHYANWELGGAGMNCQSKYQLYVIYKPLSNVLFNNWIIKMRTRLGTKLIPVQETFRKMISLRKDDEINATAFIADQTPFPGNAYWTRLLNQDTPIFLGPEIIASKLNYPIVYISINRIKRGYYEMQTEMLCENPKDTKKGEISEIYTRRLEKDILNNPSIWLWSHKRWKHEKPAWFK